MSASTSTSGPPAHSTTSPGIASTTASTDPSGTTSSPAFNSTTPPPPASAPGAPPAFFTDSDGATYTNTTIDDFSPLVTFSNVEADWKTPLTDSALSATRPVPQRAWHLGTYRRTEQRNATIRIEFWGSEIRLYGDDGPAYGAFALTLDNGTPILQTAFYPALAVGPAHFVHALMNLTEGRHELVITVLGTRDGLIEGPGFLFDYALVRQKVGVPGRPAPKAFDLTGDGLLGLKKNGTWSLSSLELDTVNSNGTIETETRTAYSTTENGASVVHAFKGTAIQVFGTRNATHGLYRATLTSSSNTSPSSSLLSQVYNASAPCGFPPPADPNVAPACEWGGSVLKFAAANLDPDVAYELRLENVHEAGRERTVFDVDLIRVISLSNATDPGSGGGTGTGSGQVGTGGSSGAARLGPDPFAGLLVAVMSLWLVWRSMRI